jgi:hypothetical protein
MAVRKPIGRWTVIEANGGWRVTVDRPDRARVVRVLPSKAAAWAFARAETFRS